MPSSETCVVFIDGAYLRLIANHFGKRGKFDIRRLAGTFAEDAGVSCAHVYYYAAPPYQDRVPTAEDNARKANYDKFVSKLGKIPDFTVREGRCQKIDGRFRQKGVDALIVMDLARLPHAHGSVKNAIIVTSDTDFVPVLNSLREQGIRVVLYFYSDYVRNSRFSMSNHLYTACDERKMISPSHFDRSHFR